MIVIVGVAFVSGVVTFLAALSHSLLAALCAAPVVGSSCALLAGLGIAWQADRRELADRRMQARIDEAVAGLRDVAAKARGETAPAKGASPRKVA